MKFDGVPEGAVVSIEIKVYADGAMSVSGPLADKAWMLSALDHAKDSVRNHQSNAPSIIVPGRDTNL